MKACANSCLGLRIALDFFFFPPLSAQFYGMSIRGDDSDD